LLILDEATEDSRRSLPKKFGASSEPFENLASRQSSSTKTSTLFGAHDRNVILVKAASSSKARVVNYVGNRSCSISIWGFDRSNAAIERIRVTVEYCTPRDCAISLRLQRPSSGRRLLDSSSDSSTD